MWTQPDSRRTSRLSIRRLLGTAGLLAALLGLALEGSARRPARAAQASDVLTSRPRTAGKAPRVLPANEGVRTGVGERRRVALAGGCVVYVNQETSARATGPRELRLDQGEVLLDVPAGDRGEPCVVHTPGRKVTVRSGRFAVRAGARGTSVVVASGRAEVAGVAGAIRAGQQLAAEGEKPEPAPRASHLLAWARDLMAEADSPLVPGSRHAGGQLVVTDPDGQEARLALRKYHIDVHVEDGFARTTIDQTYFNHTHGRLEGTFYFPLPPDASLSRLAMYVEGKLMEGGMAERDHARNVFEQVIYQQRDPALLEWVDGSTFKMRVFPLEPRQEKRLVLSYTQKLPTLYGQTTFRFPAGHTLERVRDWSFHAVIKGGAKLAWNSSSHRLKARTAGADLLLDAAEKDARPGRDVVLTLDDASARAAGAETVRFSSAEQEGSRYLMVRYRPGLPGFEERQRRDWVVLFESSGDRDPLLARTQVEVVRGLLAGAEEGDTLAVLTAGTRVQTWSKEPRPLTAETMRDAIGFLEKSHLVGALDLGQALTEAERFLKGSANPYLVHVGGGIAAMGERRDDVLARRIPDGTHYVGVGVGRRWNRAFMKAAAERTAGYFTQVNPDEEVSWRAFDLAATLNTPRLLDVRVTDRDGKATFLPFARSLTQGEEVAAIARLDEKQALPEAVVVRGTLNGQPFERELTVREVAAKADYLPRTWAKLEIERLLAEDARKNKDRIVALSKAMYVMTPFTSLLVLENEEMYVQFKVDRGRKDHWAIYPCPERIPVVYEPEDGPPGDPRKGIKPSPRQVLKTITVRQRPSVLSGRTDVSAKRSQDTPRGFIAADLRVNLAVPPPAPSKLPLNSPEETRADIEPVRDYLGYMGQASNGEGLAVWSGLEPSSAGITGLQDRDVTLRAERPARRNRETAFLKGANDAEHEGLPSLIATNGGLMVPDSHQLERLPRLARLAERGGIDPSVLEAEMKSLQDMQARSPRSVSGEEMRELQQALQGARQMRGSLLYQRPSYSGDDHLFFDLVSYAPGLNTSTADIRAVIEAEAAPTKSSKLGTIDDGARALFEKSRSAGWRICTLPAEGSRAASSIAFDGQGRFAWEGTLPIGLRERVVCDGATLWHLYPDLGLAARRAISRFHRLDLARLVPGWLPRPEDLARGSDLRLLDKRTAALVPHGAGTKGADGKPLPYVQAEFVFAEDGRLAEQRLVRMPEGKTVWRQTYAADGTVKVLAGDGKERAALKVEFRPAEQPSLKPAVKGLVVLPLPYRTREHVVRARGLEKKNSGQLTFEEGFALVAADFAAGNNSVVEVCQQCFFNRDQHPLGLYVLLAAAGHNLDGEHIDVLGQHLNEPLAQYLALHTSPVLRKHASQWAVGSNTWGEGFLHRLALAHALLQRWQNGKALIGTETQRQAERKRALDFVRQDRSAFGWALLGLMQDRAREDEANKKDVRGLYKDLAGAWGLYAELPSLEYAARYEQARSLWKSGQAAEARKAFRDLYEQTWKDGAMPAIDSDFRTALLSGQDEWDGLLRQTAARLIEKKERGTVLALALQCWQLDDQPLADRLLETALEGVPAGKEGLSVRLAGLSLLWETGQLARADEALSKLLAEPDVPHQAALWRLAAKLAERRDMPAREMECLEHALDAEYANLPEVVNLQQVRQEYEKLLGHYQNLAQSLAALKIETPAGFRAKVVRTADRWRSLDRDGERACRLAARILHTLGDRDLSWDYLTTPVGLQPNEAGPWANLARDLARRGEPVLADRAYRAACEAEPTDAQMLWDRAANLRQTGQVAQARELYRQLAEGTWQPRFRRLQEQARQELARQRGS
jgi:Tfp pilus assembly protein PilF